MKNEDAVSPVIGVILMVVITVIIAAVMAIFAFGVEEPAKTPVAKLEFRANNDMTNTGLCISNKGGDSLVLSELVLSVNKAGQNGEPILNSRKMDEWNPAQGPYLLPGKRVCGLIDNSNEGDVLTYKIIHNPSGQAISDTSGRVILGSLDISTCCDSTPGPTPTTVKYSIVVTQNSNGVIAPAGTTGYDAGSTPSFTITPDPGYHIASITTNAGVQPVTSPYVFPALSSNDTLTATFAANTPVIVTQSPSAESGGWSHASYAYADGSPYAESHPDNKVNIFSGYGFTIPSGATITQVRVRVDAFVSGEGVKLILEISSNGGTPFTPVPGDISPGTLENTYWKDVTDLASWTPANINDNQIQTRIAYIEEEHDDKVSLDWIPIEVTYIPP
jgi:FlaG/FlaF family flagellin (archaellin)